MTQDENDTEALLHRAMAADAEAWRLLLAQSEDRLRRMISFRMDQRLQGRIDPGDVLQDAYVEAFECLPRFLEQKEIPFFLWLRGIIGNKLRELHRHHLGTRMRDAGREISLYRGTMPETTSAALAAQLLGHGSRPSEQAIRVEVKVRLQEALNTMDPIDREVLALRHFEQLSNAEAAQILGIQTKAAGKRYLRALKRLKEILAGMPGGLSGIEP